MSRKPAADLQSIVANKNDAAPAPFTATPAPTPSVREETARRLDRPSRRAVAFQSIGRFQGAFRDTGEARTPV